MTHADDIITISHATKRFGKLAAADDVSVVVKPGEVVGFVGVNGAGKTTTINMLLGFTSPSRGHVSLFGQPVTTANAHKSHRRIGYAAGDMELPDRITGRQYIDFVLAQTNGKHDQRLKELCEVFQPQLDKKIKTLSRGNKQKLALVAAFVAEPELVVLDEPTSGLDPIMQDAFLDLVRAEQTKGTTIFMSSHYLQEVSEVCTRVLLMKNGRIVEDLSAEELRQISGKAVRIVSSKAISVPGHHVKQLLHDHTAEGLITSFVYDGPINGLQKWLGSIDHVTDIDVSERTLEAEFRSLYAEMGSTRNDE